MSTHSTTGSPLRAAVALLATVFALAALLWPVSPEATSVIVQGPDVAAAAAAVRDAGGTVTHELGIINAVGATLSPQQVEVVRAAPGPLRVHSNRGVKTAEEEIAYTEYPARVAADALHAEGIDGRGVTVAVVDSGFMLVERLRKTADGEVRLLRLYNAIKDVEQKALDIHGHGSHVTSIILNSERIDGKFNSIAPAARVVSIKAFDKRGQGTYLWVIRGLDWILAKKDVYDIRVVNLSFSAPPRSNYWDDPLNQAVMRLWQEGLVVVASAGNDGPDPMSVGVPGNVPYVITVGAMTDNYTPGDGEDDRLASFSSVGPTYEGFVKPDLVAPGGHMVALTRPTSRLAEEHPEFHFADRYFTMSGTSQAAAVVTGVVTLMLQDDPTLTPDDVKCALISTATPANDPEGNRAYSIFQQGAGLVDAHAAIHDAEYGCANGGLNIHADLAGTHHFGGPAGQDESGNYVLLGEVGDGYTWDGSYSGGAGYPWSNGYPWNNGYPWANGYPWSSGYPWANGYPWNSGYPWNTGLAEPASVNVWVPQE